jgi:hypothetical protein
MFIHHTIHLDQPIDDCAAVLARDPRRWFPRLTDEDFAVGARIAGISVHKKVVVEVGQPARAGTYMSVPLTWRASFAQRLFPEMAGTIELAPVDTRVTRLTVSGMYEPPFGRLGRELDAALLHRVATATVKDLAESISQRLRARAPQA